jgi:hypothetical protein
MTVVKVKEQALDPVRHLLELRNWVRKKKGGNGEG